MKDGTVPSILMMLGKDEKMNAGKNGKMNSLEEYSNPRKRKLSWSTVPSKKKKCLKKCFCDTDECKQRYKRHPKHPRILEPSTKLMKPGFNYYHGQIRMPEELQKQVGYGSCKKCYKALITLLTYIQLNSGFVPIPSIKQKFVNPTENDYCKLFTSSKF